MREKQKTKGAMMISKQTKNSGASGGNGMQSFSIDYLQDCEVYHEYKKGHVIYCPCCGEEYHLAPETSVIESLDLMKVLKEEKCPFCTPKEGMTKEYLENFMKIKGKFLHYQFEIEGGKFISAYRKPIGWKPISKTELAEALADKEAA
jgi:hypothetical protein